MAEKTLNTRIINKHAELSAWNTSSLTLKAGEIALARVETTKPDGNGGFYKVPTYLMKVGDGDKTFSQLEWLAAPASDVYAWAKKEHMAASDIPVFTEDDAARIAPTFATAIANLQSALGTGGSVMESIQTAIEALDVTDTEVGDAETAYQVVTAVSETDGKISVTRRALGIKDIAELQAALNAKLDVATYNSDKAASDALIAGNTSAIAQNAADIGTLGERVTNVQNDLQGKVTTAQGAAEAAQADATAALNKIGTGYDAENTVAKDITAVKASVTAEAEARAAADTDLQGQITAVKATADAAAVKATVDAKFEEVDEAVEAAQADATAALDKIGDGFSTSATVASKIAAVEASVTAEAEARAAADNGLDSRIQTLEGKIVDLSGAMHFKGVKDEVPTDFTDYVDGDVIIVGNKEYVFDSASEVKFVEFGDVDDVTSRISTLEGQVSTLNANSATKAELEAAQSTLQGSIDTKAAQADLDTTNANVATAQGAAEAAQADATAALNKIGTGYDAENTVAKDIAAVKASVTAEAEARAAADNALQASIDTKAAQADLNTTNANVATAQAAAEAAQAAAEAAQGTADDAVASIGEGFSASATVASKIAAVEASVTAEAEARAAADNGLQASINTKAAQADLDTTNANVATAQGAAEAAQADATAALNKIGTGYDAENTVAKDIAAVKASVSAIQEDYLTAADTYIFDCGGAV